MKQEQAAGEKKAHDINFHMHRSVLFATPQKTILRFKGAHPKDFKVTPMDRANWFRIKKTVNLKTGRKFTYASIKDKHREQSKIRDEYTHIRPLDIDYGNALIVVMNNKMYPEHFFKNFRKPKNVPQHVHDIIMLIFRQRNDILRALGAEEMPMYKLQDHFRKRAAATGGYC